MRRGRYPITNGERDGDSHRHHRHPCTRYAHVDAARANPDGGYPCANGDTNCHAHPEPDAQPNADRYADSDADAPALPR